MRPTRCPSMNANRLTALLLLAATSAIAAPVQESVVPLVQQALPGVPDKQFTAVTVTFPPGGRAVPHRHGTAFLYAYGREGSICSQVEGQPLQTFHVGQGWTKTMQDRGR